MMDDRRPMRSASHPHSHDPSTVPLMPNNGSSATGTCPCGFVAALRPYSLAMPGATNESAAGFMTSITIATEMTSSIVTCCQRSGVSSSAVTRIRAAFSRIWRALAGTSP